MLCPYIGKRLSFLTVGPSLAGSSEILMASSMAASRPLPPSPLSAGPKHSGLLISSRTTTLAFSSTLSPESRTLYKTFNLILYFFIIYFVLFLSCQHYLHFAIRTLTNYILNIILYTFLCPARHNHNRIINTNH